MIYDKLENISFYLGMHPHLDTALRYIASHDLNELSFGRTEVDGANVFINVMEASARPEEEISYEIHRSYMDIQIDLTGVEAIQIGDMMKQSQVCFNEETDFGTVCCPTSSSCIMGPGSFIICMAGEPHKPGIATGPDRSLKKCVVKVHV